MKLLTRTSIATYTYKGVYDKRLHASYSSHRGSTNDVPLLLISKWCCLTEQGSPSVMQHVVSVESSSLLLHSIEKSFGDVSPYVYSYYFLFGFGC